MNGLTLIQQMAICFTAGVVGGAAVVLFSHVLFALGIGGKLGANAPISSKSPDIYKPLFWGGLWGLPFALLLGAAGKSFYLFGFLYFLVPLAALYLIFLPKAGAGMFGLKQGPKFPVYLLLVNLPYGIVTALAANWIL